MSTKHFKREVLIDFLDGELPEHVARKVHDHLEGCRECRDHVRSLERVFSLAGEDAVPEQPEAYWANFGDGVRVRLRSRGVSRGPRREPSRESLWERILAILRPTAMLRPAGGTSAAGARAGWRRLALVVSPALAVTVALVFALMRADGPERLADRIEPQLDQMTLDEIASSMSGDALFGDMFIEAADEEISAIEQYLLETEEVNQLIENLADDEMRELASTLTGLMKQKGTHIFHRDSVGRLS